MYHLPRLLEVLHVGALVRPDYNNHNEEMVKHSSVVAFSLSF